MISKGKENDRRKVKKIRGRDRKMKTINENRNKEYKIADKKMKTQKTKYQNDKERKEQNENTYSNQKQDIYDPGVRRFYVKTSHSALPWKSNITCARKTKNHFKIIPYIRSTKMIHFSMRNAL